MSATAPPQEIGRKLSPSQHDPYKLKDSDNILSSIQQQRVYLRRRLLFLNQNSQLQERPSNLSQIEEEKPSKIIDKKDNNSKQLQQSAGRGMRPQTAAFYGRRVQQAGQLDVTYPRITKQGSKPQPQAREASKDHKTDSIKASQVLVKQEAERARVRSSASSRRILRIQSDLSQSKSSTNMIFMPSMGFISQTPYLNPTSSSALNKSSANIAAASQSMKQADHQSVVNILSRLEEEALLFNQTYKRPLYSVAQKKRHSLPVTPLDTSLVKTALSKVTRQDPQASDMFERNPYDLELNGTTFLAASHILISSKPATPQQNDESHSLLRRKSKQAEVLATSAGTPKRLTDMGETAKRVDPIKEAYQAQVKIGGRKKSKRNMRAEDTRKSQGVGPWEAGRNDTNEIVASFASSTGVKEYVKEPELKPLNHKRMEKIRNLQSNQPLEQEDVMKLVRLLDNSPSLLKVDPVNNHFIEQWKTRCAIRWHNQVSQPGNSYYYNPVVPHAHLSNTLSDPHFQSTNPQGIQANAMEAVNATFTHDICASEEARDNLNSKNELISRLQAMREGMNQENVDLRYKQYLNDVEVLNNSKESLRLNKDLMSPQEMQEAAADIMTQEQELEELETRMGFVSLK